MRTTLGSARGSDLPQLAGLLGLLFAQEAEFKPDVRKQRRGLSLILGDPRKGRIFVARSGAKVVGMVLLLYTISTAEGAPVAWLEDLVVDPEQRGRGVGSRLLRYALAYARKKGLRRVTLLTDRTNRRAAHLYRREGFRVSSMKPFRLNF